MSAPAKTLVRWRGGLLPARSTDAGEAHHPESAERVEWTETRKRWRRARESERRGSMAGVRRRRPRSSKRLAGVAATGRKLEKPVCHYSTELGQG